MRRQVLLFGRQLISTFVRHRYTSILSSASYISAHSSNQVFCPLAYFPRFMLMSRRLEGKLFQTVGAAEQKLRLPNDVVFLDGTHEVTVVRRE